MPAAAIFAKNAWRQRQVIECFAYTLPSLPRIMRPFTVNRIGKRYKQFMVRAAHRAVANQADVCSIRNRIAVLVGDAFTAAPNPSRMQVNQLHFACSCIIALISLTRRR